ncbi:MAG: hypothetical protein QG616_1164, partial [Pseudomonadota bacterium]|nr:hypothetical protein [Pseudomonadota bacterium]
IYPNKFRANNTPYINQSLGYFTSLEKR